MRNHLFGSEFTDEIYRSMEKQLVSNQVEDKHGFKRIAQAVEYLGAAAEIFDEAGMISEAEETVKVLHSLATSEEELLERYPEATSEHKCPALMDGWSSIEDCFEDCPEKIGLRDHEYFDDLSRGKDREESNKESFEEDMKNNPFGDDSEMPFANEVSKVEQDKEEGHALHLKYKDKVRERTAKETIKAIQRLAGKI